MSWRSARLLPLVAMVSAGCFATRNDVRVVQTNVLSTQQQLSQLIAAQTAEIERARARAAVDDSLRTDEREKIQALLTVMAESVSVLANRANRDRALTIESLDGLSKQVLMLQQLSGASAKQMRDALAAIEARRAEVAPAPAAGTATGAAKPDSTAAAAAAAAASPPQTPGPAQLYVMGRDMIQRGNYATGRTALEELLATNATAPQAPQALLLVGESYARELNQGAADSVYQQVVKRYPKSDAAPQALYKRALSLEKAQPKKARELCQQIVDQYRTSNESGLAADMIKRLPPG